MVVAFVGFTGGEGFIGSHTWLVLLEAGHDLVVLDNYANSSPEALRRVVELAGTGAEGRLQVIEGDIHSNPDLERAVAAGASTGAGLDAVIHYAVLIAVGGSVAEPLRYWDVNVSGSQHLLAEMRANGCRTLVFSSSATLYGYPRRCPSLKAHRSNRSIPTATPKQRWSRCSVMSPPASRVGALPPCVTSTR